LPPFLASRILPSALRAETDEKKSQQTCLVFLEIECLNMNLRLSVKSLANFLGRQSD